MRGVGLRTRKFVATSLYTPPPPPPQVIELKHDFEGAVSFSQRGEDLIAVDWLYKLGQPISKFRYLDIGANHPRFLSNTYLLYTMGVRGVLVEPNPDLMSTLHAYRHGDVIIEAGIAFDERRTATLYRQADDTLNGYLSKSSEGACDEITTTLIPINDVLSEHFSDRAPEFLSIDTEDCDYQILLTMDFERWRPYMICVETGHGTPGLPELLLDKGYEIIFHTTVNTMFISKDYLAST
jgi:FkbM family methyltransferase